MQPTDALVRTGLDPVDLITNEAFSHLRYAVCDRLSDTGIGQSLDDAIHE